MANQQHSSSLTECLQQLRQLLGKDDDFGQQCSSAADLCSLLADGETLCCLLSVLSDGRVSPEADGTVSFYSVNSELLGRRNVNFFLEKCCEHFGMDRKDLFELDDLLLMRRPERVVAALQRLLQMQRQQPSLSSRRQSEEIYMNMDELVPSQGRPTETCEVPHIVAEICSSERLIVTRLTQLLKFRHELRGILSEWSPAQLSLTFQHTESLLAVHRHFQERLDQLESRGTAAFCLDIGQLFVQMKPQFVTTYAKFFSDHPLARAQLDKDFKLQPQLQRQLQLLENHFKTESFNILFECPLKQMFNYQLLFDRLLQTVLKSPLAGIRATASSVEKALDQSRCLLSDLNERKRYAEHCAATKQLLQSVDGLPEHLTRLDNVGLHRGDGRYQVKLGREAPLGLVSDAQSNRVHVTEPRDCFCILTDRLLIVSQNVPGSSASLQPRHEFLFEVPLGDEDLQLEHFGSGELGGGLQVKHARIGAVQFSRPNGKKSYAGPNLWTQLVKTRAENFPDGYNSAGHLFQRMTFDEDSACSRCNKAFVGLYFQGYYCQHCNQRLDRACLSAYLRQRPVSSPAIVEQLQQQVQVHDRLDRTSAEAMLRHGTPGSFLFRRNEERTVLSIVWHHGQMFHVIVKEREFGSVNRTQFSVDSKSGYWHDSLSKLAKHYKTNSLTIGSMEGIRLVEPMVQAVVAYDSL